MTILNEESRNNLIAKSKNSVKGLERYKKRVKSRVASSTQEFNQIDMNKLFKDNILEVSIKVNGETDNYLVKISFGGILDSINKEINRTGELDLRSIIRGIINTFNSSDVYISCTCPDFYYRFGYYATVNKYNSGTPQLIPSKETNPNDKLGSACKHSLLVLGNTSWIIKVASVINNYVEYMQKHNERLYQQIIYPAIYNKKYEEPIQLDVFDDTLASDEETITKSNIEARRKGQFKPGNPYRFTKNIDNQGQLTIDEVENIESEEDNE